MRTNISLPVALAFLLLLAFTSYRCNNDKCDTPIEITQILPDNNPVGYEIQIKGQGFTQAAMVRFGTKTAVTRWYEEESTLIAEVPTGLSGLVEVTVEEGDCIARADFEVTSSYTTDWPPSLTQIVIPQNPTAFPADFNNLWRNYADDNHRIFLESVDSTIQIGPTSTEYHLSIGNLNENPVKGTVDIAQNEIFLTIDRSAHVGGMNDTLDGQFINPQAVGITDTITYPFVIWLQSRVNGRQIVLVQ